MTSAVTDRARVVIATLLAVLAGHIAWLAAMSEPKSRDFGQAWYAARAVLQGVDPYKSIGPGRAFQWEAPFFYPLPAALVATPLAPLSEAWAVASFSALGAFLLAWALMAHGYGSLLAFTSFCVGQAVFLAQWAPLLAGATVFAPLSAILIAKPTVGAAVFAARPSLWALNGAAVLLALSFALQPGWVVSWMHALQAASIGAGQAFPYSAPVMIPGGALALLCLLRWRRPEARLVAALACVPQTTLPYEGVLLFLVPRGWRQTATLAILSHAIVWMVRYDREAVTLSENILAYGPMMVACLYLPVTFMVLRRPNEGVLPGWIEWRIAAWPLWLRGNPPKQS